MGDMLETGSPAVEEVTPVAAMKIFRSKDRTGETSSSNYSLSTTHQSHITQLNIISGEIKIMKKEGNFQCKGNKRFVLHNIFVYDLRKHYQPK